ncbi:unnamed protein product [Gadus morhua 'NCC']
MCGSKLLCCWEIPPQMTFERADPRGGTTGDDNRWMYQTLYCRLITLAFEVLQEHCCQILTAINASHEVVPEDS